MKKNIALVTGGYSRESEISIKSAAVVKNFFDSEKYEIYTIIIQNTNWYYLNNEEQKIAINKNDFSIELGNRIVKFDLVFMALHGTPGEDGQLQAYFDLLGIPYTTCNMLTSAITFNKAICKTVVKDYGAKLANSIMLKKTDKYNTTEILKTINLPCFVKPNNGGSSIGMSRVNKPENLESAICLAFKEDNEILIEEFISGTEVTCGMIKYKEELITFPLTEIVSKKEFFDFEAKYTKGKSEEITPARISESNADKIRMISKNLYKKLNCFGIVRFDYILNNDEPYFLEVNTIPGMTEESIVPQQARAMGISEKQLYQMLIEETLNKSKT